MKWEDKLVGHHFTIVTDHQALETIKTSNRDGRSGRLICWDEYLSRFSFSVKHVPGSLNKVADCLSRYYENDRSDEHHDLHDYVSADLRLDPNKEDLTDLRLLELQQDEVQVLARRIRDHNEQRLAEADELAKAAAGSDPDAAEHDTDGMDMELAEALQTSPSLCKVIYSDKKFIVAVAAGYDNDTFFSKITSKPAHFPSFTLENGLLYTNNHTGQRCLCVPQSRLKEKQSLPEIVINHAHNTLGHLSAQKTSEYAWRWFWWPRMGRDIERFCMSCGTCQMMKTSNRPKPGLLHNLPVPNRPWQSIGMDFVGPFPRSQNYDYLWVVICRLMSMVHLIPLTVRTKTTELAWFYIRDVVRLHGMPDSIVSDRDSKFTARFWRELHRLMGTKLLMSTSFHPQTDGHTECANRSVGQILRSIISPDQWDWVLKLPLVEFALNSTLSSSTGFAPFELNYSYKPQITPFEAKDTMYPSIKEFAQRARA